MFAIARFPAVAALLLAARLAPAQALPLLRLSAPTGTLTADFSSVTSIRELADGRLLVVDSREQKLVVADFRTDAVSQIGRAGLGPGEYRNPRTLLSLSGDTTVLLVPGPRWMVLVGAGVAATWGPEQLQRINTRGVTVGATVSGDVYSAVPGPASCHESPSDRPDTVFVVRTSRTSPRTDTVGRFLVAPTTRRTANLNGSITTRCMPPVLPPNESAAAFPDGWLAIARHSPYRVDWRDAGGVSHSGKPMATELPPVTARDRRAIIDSFPSRPGRMPEFDFDHFPAHAPAFQDGALTPMPDGRLLIKRTLLASDMEARYDIVDRNSNLSTTLRMPRNQRVAGFGRASIYAVTVDDDGLQHITRHAWP